LGATGGTGRLIVRDAVAKGHFVVALVRSTARADLPAADLIKGDARDERTLGRALGVGDSRSHSGFVFDQLFLPLLLYLATESPRRCRQVHGGATDNRHLVEADTGYQVVNGGLVDLFFEPQQSAEIGRFVDQAATLVLGGTLIRQGRTNVQDFLAPSITFGSCRFFRRGIAQQHRRPAIHH